jgi:hypothetical protein
MTEVKINKEQAIKKRETLASTGLFRPAFPFSRFFGGEPFEPGKEAKPAAGQAGQSM